MIPAILPFTLLRVRLYTDFGCRAFLFKIQRPLLGRTGFVAALALGGSLASHLLRRRQYCALIRFAQVKQRLLELLLERVLLESGARAVDRSPPGKQTGRLIIGLEQDVERRFQRRRQTFQRFKRRRSQSGFNAGNVAPQQSCGLFEIGLREALLKANFAQPLPYGCGKRMSDGT